MTQTLLQNETAVRIICLIAAILTVAAALSFFAYLDKRKAMPARRNTEPLSRSDWILLIGMLSPIVFVIAGAATLYFGWIILFAR
jgi:hypothetical protein